MALCSFEMFYGKQAQKCFRIRIFVCFDSLPPSQQLFHHFGMGLPGLYQ